MKTTVEVIAENIDTLRRADVFCLLNMSFDDERDTVAETIRSSRPDMADEVDTAMRVLSWT